VRSRDASDDEVRRLHHGTEVLDAFLPAVTVFVHECWSKAPIELQDGKDFENEMVKLAYTAAGSYVLMACDHLVALRQVLAGGVLPSSACYTLIRGCAEASVRASWLADPTIPHWKRVQRGISERLSNAEAHYKIQKDDPAYDKSRYVALINRIFEEAVANGISAKQSTKPGGVRRLDIESRPPMTVLMDEQLQRLLGQKQPQTWYYALLSAYAHSAHFTVLLNGTPGTADEHGLRGVDVSANVMQILKVTDPAVALLAQSTKDFGLMVGRNDAPGMPGLVSGNHPFHTP
jgi:hypothetical protein